MDGNDDRRPQQNGVTKLMRTEAGKCNGCCGFIAQFIHPFLVLGRFNSSSPSPQRNGPQPPVRNNILSSRIMGTPIKSVQTSTLRLTEEFIEAYPFDITCSAKCIYIEKQPFSCQCVSFDDDKMMFRNLVFRRSSQNQFYDENKFNISIPYNEILALRHIITYVFLDRSMWNWLFVF